VAYSDSHYAYDDYNHKYEFKVYYKKSSASSWILYAHEDIDDKYSQYKYYPYTISGLSADVYQWKLEIISFTYGDYVEIDEWSDWANVVVDNGDVMWLAVEGGAD